MSIDDIWYDDEAGPIVRLFAITGGRTEAPAGDFTLSTIVQRVPGAVPGAELSLAESTIVQLTERPLSVSEIAARLGLPLGSVRVILGDLRDADLVTVPRSRDAAERPSLSLLQQVLSGLNSL
jgi:DNA-binding transcriptional ArsR family regulator